MKRLCCAVATLMLSSTVGYGAIDLNLSSGASSIVIQTGSSATIPVDVYVTDTGSDSLAGYNVAVTLSALGTASTFKPGLGAAVDHIDIIPDQQLFGGVSGGELQVSGYAPGPNEQYAIANDGGLFSFDLVVPALGVGTYTLGFDSSETFLFDNTDATLATGTLTGATVTVVAAPESGALPLLLLGIGVPAVVGRFSRSSRQTQEGT